ncbi:hypothetical protein VTH82DRAFT_6996 [Thermothelomyces myriococcoides]
MSSHTPMPFDCDIPSVLSLARSVAADLSRAPDVFMPGEGVVNALVMELEVLRRLCSSARPSQANGGVLDESSLAAHLLPCRAALKNMLDIRQRYAGQTLGLGDSLRWRRDEKRFDKEIAALQQATTQLRETSQLLQQTSMVSSSRPPQERSNTASSQSGRGFRSNMASLTTTGSTLSSGDSPPLPMCPRGSGCREPYCHQRHSHPGAPKCEDGKNCCTPGCTNWHPKSPYCPNGPTCPTIDSGCPKAHPWPRVVQKQQQQQQQSQFSDDGSYWGSQSTETLHGQTGRHEYQITGGRAPSYPPRTQITVVSSMGEISSAPDAAWCPLRFSCPGYGGACPLRHPRRAPCRDGNACTKGSACTYDHSSFQGWGGGNGPRGFVAELPASPEQFRYK